MANATVETLPDDVVINIFLRLPVKSLMRFKCVFKTWFTLIQSSTFVNLHIYRKTTTNNQFILFKRSIKEPNRLKPILSFISIINDCDDVLRPSFPDLDMSYLTAVDSGLGHRLMGPCNGLIALTDKENAILFNPATRQYRLLKPNSFGYPLGFHGYIDGVGFGFDSIANDYKIVRISLVHGDPPFYDFHMRERKVDIYDLSIDSWRESDVVDKKFSHVDWYPCSERLYKGASHWIGYANKEVILCFDMSTEIFRKIEMPKTCHSNDGKSYSLLVLNECLTLICYRYSGSAINLAIDLMDIWVMKVYGVNDTWIKKYTVRPLSIESPLAVWNDHLLLFESKIGCLISYNLSSDEVKELNLHGWPESLEVTVYKESLTSIPKGHEHSVRLNFFGDDKTL